ncbi:hypothetical protein BDY24DRAFT_388163 [Mrakia frigida]|uniref:uncharacterized protein n=1 Tax=Mrakia frigida TaxID=29902 RepID=UPI003FCBEE64
MLSTDSLNLQISTRPPSPLLLRTHYPNADASNPRIPTKSTDHLPSDRNHRRPLRPLEAGSRDSGTSSSAVRGLGGSLDTRTPPFSLPTSPLPNPRMTRKPRTEDTSNRMPSLANTRWIRSKKRWDSSMEATSQSLDPGSTTPRTRRRRRTRRTRSRSGTKRKRRMRFVLWRISWCRRDSFIRTLNAASPRAPNGSPRLSRTRRRDEKTESGTCCFLLLHPASRSPLIPSLSFFLSNRSTDSRVPSKPANDTAISSWSLKRRGSDSPKSLRQLKATETSTRQDAKRSSVPHRSGISWLDTEGLFQYKSVAFSLSSLAFPLFRSPSLSSGYRRSFWF